MVTQSAGFWRSVHLWSLIPGNILALVLLVVLQQHGAVKPPVVVYRHVFHTRVEEVWQGDGLRVSGRRKNDETNRTFPRIDLQPHMMQQQHEGRQKHLEDAGDSLNTGNNKSNVNYELMYLWNDKAYSFDAADLPNDINISELQDQGMDGDDDDGRGSSNDNSIESEEDEDNDEEDEDEDNEEKEEKDNSDEKSEAPQSSPGDTSFVKLRKQVKPLHHNTFYSYRRSGCSRLCEQLKASGNWSYTSKSPSFVLIHGYSSSSDRFRSQKKSVVNFVGNTGAACLGGSNAAQLKCRHDYAHNFGCDYNALGLQPRQWNMQDLSDCRAFIKHAVSDTSFPVFVRMPHSSPSSRTPSLGEFTVHNDTSKLKSVKGSCKKKFRDAVILQEYVAQPMLVHGAVFTLRMFMLVASTDPLLVFFHDGFALVATSNMTGASSDDRQDPLLDAKAHVTATQADMEQMRLAQLGVELGDVDLVPRVLRKAKRAALVVLHSAKIERRQGRFQLFAMDWAIDSKGDALLVDVLGDVLMVEDHLENGKNSMFGSMLNLVNSVHIDPGELHIPNKGNAFRYDDQWQILYNELAQDAVPINQLNPCL